MWNYQGPPRHGIYNDNRLLCKSKYKQATRIARLNFERNLSVKLLKNLMKGGAKSF